MTRRTSAARDDVLVAAIPVAAAIALFGAIYGAAARPVLGPGLAIITSLVLFSGAAQFALVALIATGAGTAAVIGATAALALRHLPFGAVLRPRMRARRSRRALVALVLTDESAGLALASPRPVERTIAASGLLFYVAFAAGTVLGVAGAALGDVEPLAAALFPVLFVGLAALTARTRSDATRAGIAGGASIVLLLVWPGAGALGAIGVAVLVSGFGRREP